MVKGSEMMLEGQVSGSVPFTVSFYKNTKLIRNDKRHRITVKDDLVALQVLAVEAGDVGLYQCTVENEVGRASCDCQVTLKGWFRCYGFISESTFLLLFQQLTFLLFSIPAFGKPCLANIFLKEL